MSISIITHRGLEPSQKQFFPESSIEAFNDQLNRGFGIEFDPNFVTDGIVVSHDSTLGRITNGKNKRAFSALSEKKVTAIFYGKGRKGHVPTLNELLVLMNESIAKIHAMHLKGKFQDNTEHITWLVNEIENYPTLWDRMIIFDIKPAVAKRIKKHNELLHLAPSVAHPYDIKRFNKAVSGTLMTIDEAIKNRDIYDWVVLDEWDLSDKDSTTKKLHTKENYSKLRKEGFKIALVTPELHGSSPGLLGGEAHPDSESKEKLFKRIQEIIDLKPDVLITDYPEEVRNLL